MTASAHHLSARASVAQHAGDNGVPTWIDTAPQTSSAQAATTPAGQHGGPVDTAMLGRTSIGLLVVIAIILLCAWLLKRFGPNRAHNSQRLKLVASRSVGNRERVVVIEIEDQWLVLGVTPHSINRLHRLDAQPADRDVPGPPSFRQALAENLPQFGSRRPRP